MAVEAEVEAQAEAEEEAEEENDQCRKLREQNEVTERGGLGAHRGRGLCCSGAGNQGRLLVAALVDFLVWGGGRAGVGGWRLGLGCSQEQARSCSTGVEKCRPSVPVSHRPSSKPESEHPVTPCIPGFAEKGQPGRDSGPITCFSPPRARHSTIRSSSCKTKARCELCCCKSRMKERSATQRRAERMSG